MNDDLGGMPPLNATPGGAVDSNVITVHGKKAVAGLTWIPLENPRHAKAEAKRIGKARDMEMVTIRRGRITEAGFAPKTKSRFKGMYSLAATLAGKLGDDLIAAFELPDGRYAFVAVFRGSVLPNKDLIGTRERVESLLHETYSMVSAELNQEFGKETGVIIAPEDFQFSPDNRTLSEVLDAKSFKREFGLKPLAFGMTPREIAMAGIAVAGLAAIGVGTSIWLDKRAEDRARAEELQRAREADEQRLQAAEAKQEIPRPWTTQPAAAAMLEACATQLRNTPLALGGWLFVGTDCNAASGAANYERKEGAPVSAFIEAAHGLTGGPPALKSPTEGSVSAGIRLTPATDDLLRPTQQVLMALADHMQKIGDVAALRFVESPPPPADPAAAPTPPPTWTTTQFEIETTFPPERLLAGVDLAGIRISQVTTALDPEAAELTWTIKGEIYGR